MQSSELIDLTRPAAVIELLKEARCSPCQHQKRQCYVEQDAGRCLRCSSEQDCIFERSIIRSGAASTFTWEELTGKAYIPNSLPSNGNGNGNGNGDALDAGYQINLDPVTRPFHSRDIDDRSWYQKPQSVSEVQKPHSSVPQKRGAIDQNL